MLAPDGHDVREEQQEAENLEVPTAGEVLEGHHDQWHHHEGPEQDLSQTVDFQVKQTHLPWATEANNSSQMNALVIKYIQSETQLHNNCGCMLNDKNSPVLHYCTLCLGLEVFMTLRSSLPV